MHNTEDSLMFTSVWHIRGIATADVDVGKE